MLGLCRDSSRRLATWGFRAAGWGGLLFALVLLPPLASRGQEAVFPTTAKAEKTTPVSDRPAFDLTYVPPDAMGVIAVRPNVIFSDPAMRPLARMANEALVGLLPVKIPAALRPPVEEIEQVIGFITITPNKGEPKGVHTLATGLVMIRTTHDYDWLKLMRQLDPKTEEIHWKGLVYYKCRPPWLSGLSSKSHLNCFLPDKRTLVLPGPGALREGQAGETNRRPPHFSWDKDWKRIEHGLFAVALDNRWTQGMSAEQIGGEPWTKTLTQHACTLVAGVDWMDGIDFHAYLAGKSNIAADRMLKDIKAMLAEWRPYLEQTPQDVPKDVRQTTAFLSQVFKDLLEHVRITRRESLVRVHTTATINLTDVAKMFLGPMPPK